MISTEQLVKAVSHMPRLDDIDEYCIEIIVLKICR